LDYYLDDKSRIGYLRITSFSETAAQRFGK